MRALIENMPDYVLCCIPRVLEVVGKNIEFVLLKIDPFDICGGPFDFGTLFEKCENFLM